MANEYEALSSSMLTLIGMVSLTVVVLFKAHLNIFWNQLNITLQVVWFQQMCKHHALTNRKRSQISQV